MSLFIIVKRLYYLIIKLIYFRLNTQKLIVIIDLTTLPNNRLSLDHSNFVTRGVCSLSKLFILNICTKTYSSPIVATIKLAKETLIYYL